MKGDTYRAPRTAREGQAALSMRRNTGENRTVEWNHIKTRYTRDSPLFDKYLINVKDGNTLTVEVWSGIPELVVQSGHVTIKFWSSWGNILKIHPGASAHVITDAHTKVTINNSGTLSVEAPEPNRVRVYGLGQTTGVQTVREIGALP